MLALQSIIAARRDAILKSWIRDPNILIAVDTAETFGRFGPLHDGPTSGEAGRLGRRAAERVLILRQKGDRDARTSLWVSADYLSGYRSAFAAFIGDVYGLKTVTADLKGLDIDHLLNRKRAPLDSTLLRVEAVRKDVNQAWGSFYERFAKDKTREVRSLSWIQAAKIAGFAPPEGPHDERGFARLDVQFVRLGLRRAEALEGFASMFDFAFRRRMG